MTAHLFMAAAGASASDVEAARQRASADFEAALERVSADDKAFFEVNPERRYRVRPVDPAEIAPGEVCRPGARTVGTKIKQDVRLRTAYPKTPPELREDTDENAESLLHIVPPQIELESGRVVSAADWLREVTGSREEGSHES